MFSALLVQIQCGKVNQLPSGPREVLVGEDSAEKGLSLLVQQVLGKPLDKTQQMSNWEKRPLRISQIRYAGKALCMHRQTMTGSQMVAALLSIEHQRLFCYPVTKCKLMNPPPLFHSLSPFPKPFCSGRCLLFARRVLHSLQRPSKLWAASWPPQYHFRPIRDKKRQEAEGKKGQEDGTGSWQRGKASARNNNTPKNVKKINSLLIYNHKSRC